MKKTFLLAVLCLFLFINFSLLAQVPNALTCQLTPETEEAIIDRLVKNKKYLEEHANIRGTTTYVPVKIHLVGLDDSDSPVTKWQVLDMLCILNDAYEDTEIQFYLKGEINYINNTKIANHEGYDTPSGPIEIWNEANEYKAGDALNIYITNNVGVTNGGGTTLSYYIQGQDFEYDFIMIRRASMYGSNVLPHEVGHFFGLAHTFLGWEGA
ncbi:MAG: hypothetical protein AB8F74_19440, partial [Saprospiraceae bacterium]